MTNVFAYINLAIQAVSVVPVIVAEIKAKSLTPTIAWSQIGPLLTVLSETTGVKINLALAQQITTDAVDTINAATHVTPTPGS